MTAPARPPPDTPSERRVADARSADLAELLGHVTTSWDEQRRLLARQLHDSLGSSMTALTMHLALLTQQLPDDKALRDRSAQMKQLLTNIIEHQPRDAAVAVERQARISRHQGGDRANWSPSSASEHGIAARASLPEQDASYPRAARRSPCCAASRKACATSPRTPRPPKWTSMLDDDGDQVMLTVRDNGVGIGPGRGWTRPAPTATACACCANAPAYLGGQLTVALGAAAASGHRADPGAAAPGHERRRAQCSLTSGVVRRIRKRATASRPVRTVPSTAR